MGGEVHVASRRDARGFSENRYFGPSRLFDAILGISRGEDGRRAGFVGWVLGLFVAEVGYGKPVRRVAKSLSLWVLSTSK